MEEVNMVNLGFMGFHCYSVTEDGRVYSHKNNVFIKPRIHNGYWHVNLYNKKCHTVSVHRIVAKAFINGESDNLVVNHIDGNRLNNNLSNLEWVTQRGNVVNAVERGVMYKTFVTISEKTIHDACRLLCDTSKKYLEICKITGLSRTTLKNIASKNAFTHISCQYDFPKRGQGFKYK